MKNKNFEYPIILWAKELSKIYRSITGDGVVKTLNFLKTKLPELKEIKFKSGTKVFDWIIPDEWNVNDAYISNLKGKKIISFKENFLHLVSYSVPISKIVSKKELLQHLHTDKINKTAIPYVTSFYNKTWGFCIQYNKFKLLKDRQFAVHIESNFNSKGYLRCGELLKKGISKKEIFFSTYICHPVMANNESSGPSLAIAISKYIDNKYKKTKFSYRFLFNPETIGSIAYLSKFHKRMKKNVVSGYVLSCVGDDKKYSVINSPSENKISDLSLKAALINKKNVKFFSYLERGSDERQYCSPNIDLPFSTFCRSKFGEYKEYHTSKDDFKLVTKKGLNNSLEIISTIIDAFEIGLYPKSKIFCEPMLSKRNLYPTIGKNNKNSYGRKYLDVLSFSNGVNNIFQIAILTNLNLKIVINTLETLKKNNLIEFKK